MANKWLAHVKKTMKRMKKNGTNKKGDGLKKVILAAKEDYKKHKGGLSDPKAPGAQADDSSSDEEEEKPEPRTGPMVPPLPKGGRGRRSTKRRARK